MSRKENVGPEQGEGTHRKEDAGPKMKTTEEPPLGEPENGGGRLCKEAWGANGGRIHTRQPRQWRSVAKQGSEGEGKRLAKAILSPNIIKEEDLIREVMLEMVLCPREAMVEDLEPQEEEVSNPVLYKAPGAALLPRFALRAGSHRRAATEHWPCSCPGFLEKLPLGWTIGLAARAVTSCIAAPGAGVGFGGSMTTPGFADHRAYDMATWPCLARSTGSTWCLPVLVHDSWPGKEAGGTPAHFFVPCEHLGR
ncbi:hypothetical protein NDU88_003985 [Pleurodeles waltl]|uniref:Uncharacterized protein n=1 Tax=Pleurodeles waltl TaxID=8319 RepID=A0AAV7UF90_PLEWA|nr:hypothetical protein NDU88_003985 [Pleurodeles waltl]